MTLTVEDGTGLVNADSYLSVDDATAYHTAMGNSSWANRPDLYELALRNATTVTDMRFGTNYRGLIATSTQSLLFPRTMFVDNNGKIINAYTIPQSLKNSVAELALTYINNNQVLITDVTKDDALQSENVDIGGAVTEGKSYFYAIKEKNTTKSDMIIAPLLKSAGKTIMAERG